MPSIEQNNEDWKEIRSRVDSVANTIFVLAGGSLSLSMSVIISNKSKDYITEQVSELASTAWYFLLCSILLFLLLKIFLIFQAFLLQTKTELADKWKTKLNNIGWLIGIFGLISFVTGIFLMVRTASLAIIT